MITEDMKEQIRACRLHTFYTSAEWLRLRAMVLELDHHECENCKRRGKYTKANTVHHVNYVRKAPELALSALYTDEDGISKRNLVSLCHDCHEVEHGYRKKNNRKPLTEEWW